MERCRFVVERNLHDQRLQDRLNKTRDPETKEMHKQYKRFFQIMNPEVRSLTTTPLGV